MKKKVIIGNPPKHFIGAAMAIGSTVMSVANTIKANKDKKKAAMQAENSSLSQQLTQDQFELDEFQEDGVDNVNYYQAKGGTLNTDKKKKKTEGDEKPLTDEEVKEIGDSSGIAFTAEGANRLFRRAETDTMQEYPVNLGKYKDVGYFDINQNNEDGIELKSTGKNPHSYESVQQLLPELNKLNPKRKVSIAFNGDTGNRMAAGGKLKSPSYDTMGGKLDRLSSDMEEADGNTHDSSKIDNTSGIKLIKDNKAFAEIEDDETVKDGTMVYSDRLKSESGKTFAKEAAILAKQKGKAENRLKTGDSIVKNTAERSINNLDNKENTLFLEQETSKMKSSTNKLAGGGFMAGLEAASPYIDNVANGILTAFTPKVAKPNFLKPRKLNTDYNVNPQLTEVNNAVDSSVNNIENNTSNSNTARNNITSTRLKGAGEKAKILANKENVENDLKNQNTQFQMQTEGVNNRIRDQYNNDTIARAGSMREEASANIADVQNNIITGQNNKAEEEYNDKALSYVQDIYKTSGVGNRSDASALELLKLLQQKRGE